MQVANQRERAAELAAAHKAIEMARISARLGLKVIELREAAKPWTQVVATLVSLIGMEVAGD
jgi:hypothetical protein